MKKFLIAAGIIIFGTVLAVALAVLYIPSWVISRILAVPYFVFRYIEKASVAFFQQFTVSYKKAAEAKAKTIAGIGHEK